MQTQSNNIDLENGNGQEETSSGNADRKSISQNRNYELLSVINVIIVFG